MRVQTFNREAIIRTKRPSTTEPREHLDTLGILDPGFEDVGVSFHDYDVAPGITGHFATMEAPPPNYYAMPCLERRVYD